jgi:hypothetical protein
MVLLGAAALAGILLLNRFMMPPLHTAAKAAKVLL